MPASVEGRTPIADRGIEPLLRCLVVDEHLIEQSQKCIDMQQAHGRSVKVVF